MEKERLVGGVRRACCFEVPYDRMTSLAFHFYLLRELLSSSYKLLPSLQGFKILWKLSLFAYVHQI